MFCTDLRDSDKASWVVTAVSEVNGVQRSVRNTGHHRAERNLMRAEYAKLVLKVLFPVTSDLVACHPITVILSLQIITVSDFYFLS